MDVETVITIMDDSTSPYGSSNYAPGYEGELSFPLDTAASSTRVCADLTGFRSVGSGYVAVGLSDTVCQEIQLDAASVSVQLVLDYAP